MSNRPKWTNESVLRFAGLRDPVEAIVARAREIVMTAMDAGWSGPPFDPLALAENFLRVAVAANPDVPDARTVATSKDRLRIEFNPNRPRGRMRYSLAHEIAHTLFPDCSEKVRNRGTHEDQLPDDWQLEALCNIAAAEFLMPVGSFPTLTSGDLEIDKLMQVRKQFDVSAEALMLRAVQVTSEPCAMFCASRLESSGRYRVDYSLGSPSWNSPPLTGEVLPETTALSHCERIGYTAKSDEVWSDNIELHMECVGIPSYPGSSFPRVVGVLSRPGHKRPSMAKITYLKGSAAKPRGSGPKVIVHAVNDATANWGGRGFAVALMKDFPLAQDAFRKWAQQTPGALRLGRTNISEVTPGISVATIIAQRGYGDSGGRPRVRYGALQQGLAEVANVATETNATVHMPRIGCGQAGGSWDVVQEIIASTLVAKGVEVFVYDLPNAAEPKPAPQTSLSFNARN